jgi:hypothetical protein
MTDRWRAPWLDSRLDGIHGDPAVTLSELLQATSAMLDQIMLFGYVEVSPEWQAARAFDWAMLRLVSEAGVERAELPAIQAGLLQLAGAGDVGTAAAATTDQKGVAVNDTDSNGRVNAWLLQRFRRSDDRHPSREIRHLRGCPSTRVAACTHGWECGCYSEYTPDDDWRMSVDLACEHGTSGSWSGLTNVWGVLPEMIQAIKDTDLDSFSCPYDEEDE